ncbi:restriction endonuclease [Acidovorax sp. SUPP2825]|uniref:restriction endonuclease n=1 Tax=Acidovorax sp. SUPP2825 TaxID=2920879 RepID=UPI0023DE56C9|nr:restriction endonuclease [Acidovorax sp. SUPP2825]GKS93195.1 hypothetical protein AVAK2825_01690 [Acidovorax sp. SUPP2825]
MSRIVEAEFHSYALSEDAILSDSLVLSGELTTVESLLLQAVVTHHDKVLDGNVVLTLEPAWLAIQAALAKDPDLLRSLTPRQWEELVAASYDKAGYDEVILTPRSADLGRDVIAIKKGWGSVRIIDQVKALSPDRHVTANDVRALIGVMCSDHQATKGVVTTTASFAPRIAEDPMIAPHMPYRLELVDGATLFDRLKSLK